MTIPDGLTFERAASRIVRIMAAIAALGTVGAFALYGWKSGLGFLVGSAISGLNFYWIKGVVEGLAGGRRRRTLVLAFRYMILAAVAYVILMFSSASLPAVLAGVFVFTAAVFVEVAFEIAYARK
jgi:fatty acid desaturase